MILPSQRGVVVSSTIPRTFGIRPEGLTNMRKQTKIFLLVINVIIVLFLFSQELYARALHFIAYGDTRRDIKTREKPQVKHNVIARVIREKNPDFILFSGDMVYCDEFERFLEVITNNYTGSKMIPLYPVIGNHELIFGEKVDAIIKDLLKKIGVVNKSKERSSSQPELLNDLEALKRKLYLEINSIADT